MPIKLGCASDCNKKHPDCIRQKREEETIVLVANKTFGWVDCDELLQNSLHAVPHTRNGKIVE
jgi:hypothetical protein